MSNLFSQVLRQKVLAGIALPAAIAFLYATVLAKLGMDWWTDENYSHGLLVPFVIGFIVWKEWDRIRSAARPSTLFGGLLALAALLMLLAGTLAAELFTQRISLVLMLGAMVVYFLGARALNLLAVPFALLVLSIPLPQIIFNRIAFPLQLWASQIAVWGIRLFDVPTTRKGNVIDILPAGATQTISLEVVEACSGIRSLMTLVALALILGYFTRREDASGFANLSGRDLLRTILLAVAAVPIAVLTNAARVAVTGVLTYYYGRQATEGSWHDASGWLVYVVALGFLLAANLLLKKLFSPKFQDAWPSDLNVTSAPGLPSAIPLIAAILIGGLAVNWFVTRGEAVTSRRPLGELHSNLGGWKQKGSEIRFGEQIESVLKTTDYTMREYLSPDGRLSNIYVGYYSSQRTGATYHSPQNCLPGAGWIMKDPQYIEIKRSDGTSFPANRYIIENGVYREVMVYWYQGRGRTAASEYTDKLNTIYDSVFHRRSDGAIVRVMTNVGGDETAAVAAAADLSGYLFDNLAEFVPQ